jgi:hypothetical protein
MREFLRDRLHADVESLAIVLVDRLPAEQPTAQLADEVAAHHAAASHQAMAASMVVDERAEQQKTARERQRELMKRGRGNR